MNIKLGYAVSSTSEDPEDLFKKIDQIARQQTDVIELSLTREEKFRHKFTSKIIDSIKRFKYRSIHAPTLDINLKPLRYPDNTTDKLLGVVDDLVSSINPSVILFHPDIVDDFGYLNKKYGSTIAFENMDSKKSFGRTVEEMKQVFERSPHARWVFDVNHLYTNDNSMKSAKLFQIAFKDRLVHYHISGFGGRHGCFCRTHEDIILTAVNDLTKPLVHEGNPLGENLFEEETDYIKNILEKI